MFKFWHDAAMLSLESQRVIALRMMKLAMGGTGAHAEANRMMSGEDRRIDDSGRHPDERRLRSTGDRPPTGPPSRAPRTPAACHAS